MSTQLLYELIGYAASLLVAVSLMMSRLLWLRILNLVGSALFVIYGLLIGAFPIAAVNFFIVLINLYFLREIFLTKEYFTLLEVSFESRYLHYFLHFYQEELRRFMPSFSGELSPRLLFLFILRDMVPAGLFVVEQVGEQKLMVRLDFVIPQYRDFKVGQFIYSDQAHFFEERGFAKIYSQPGNKTHNVYLERMGFELEQVEGKALYSLTLG